MKKILIITNHSFMLWKFRRELIMELLKTSEVVISMPFVGHEEDFANIGCRCIETEVDRRGINPVKDVALLLTYKKLVNSEKPDMIITYSIKPNIYGSLIARQKHIPHFANVQGLGTAFQSRWLNRVVTCMYKTALKRASTVFFENEENKNLFVTRKLIRCEQACVLPGAGVNLDYYSYQAYPNNNVVHFLYLGRIMKEKGMDELFQAVEKLHDEHMRFVVDLVGFYEDEYETKVIELKEKEIVVYHGFQDDPHTFYALADCVVLPSYHEGMSNVLLEAAASGRPIITSDIAGCREAVEDGVTGLLVPKKSAEKLYQAMKTMIDMTKIARKQMGLAGRVKMEKEFDKGNVVRRTIKHLQENLQ